MGYYEVPTTNFWLPTGNSKNSTLSRNHFSEKGNILKNIITVLKCENNTFYLELWYSLQHILKSNLENENTINKTILYFLEEHEDKSLHSKDISVKELFLDCSSTEFDKLQQLVLNLKNGLPSEFLHETVLHDVSLPKYKLKQKNAKNHFHVSLEEDTLKTPELNGTHIFEESYEKYKSLIPGLTLDDFICSIKQVLTSDKSDNELENDLIEVLGFDMFELATIILCNKQLWLATINLLSNCVAEMEGDSDHSGTQSTPIANADEGDELGNIATLFSTCTIKDDGWIGDCGYGGLEESQLIITSDIPGPGDTSLSAYLGNKVVRIPSNAVINKGLCYEEVYIPPPEIKATSIETKKIKVDSLDAIGQSIFSSITEFNHVQSKVFHVAYNTSQNMLICAPTGAGKTNIALLTIAREIKNYTKFDIIHLEKFKVVYICPMKALAAEITRNFSNKLLPLKIIVKEFTGDMQLSKTEILETQIFVTTPEKWDIVTRKDSANVEWANLVKLIIIDEIHLLNSDRGPVIEALVARTLRQVLTSQSMIRIVGLSATLPNYTDIADFLNVNPNVGLFFFGDEYRSVPLAQSVIGVEKPREYGVRSSHNIDQMCFQKVLKFVQEGHQILVFVHSRNETTRLAKFIKDTATSLGHIHAFQSNNRLAKIKFQSQYSDTRILDELLESGIAVHHAGMTRHNRNAAEKYFLDGSVRVLVCTATLAWGVNLPAHAVIIKGTEIYNSKKSQMVDVDVLDVLQIFGRAGRPQFDTSGHGIILTEKSKLYHYLSALTNQLPIESCFVKALPDHLNAEIVSGTINSLQEALIWLRFTYLRRRVFKNPHVYGLLPKDFTAGFTLDDYLLKTLHSTANLLDNARMVRFNETTGSLAPTSLGRTASHFYINLYTIEKFNEMISQFMSEHDIITMMCHASEFSDMQVRKEEVEEMDKLMAEHCDFTVPEDITSTIGKVSLLMQVYLSRVHIDVVSLASDMEYINENSVRIARALFEIAFHKNYATLSGRCLTVAQAFERRMWPHQSIFRQFEEIPVNLVERLEHSGLSVDSLKEMSDRDLGNLIRNHKFEQLIKKCVHSIPQLDISSTLNPITNTVLKVQLSITPKFKWIDNIHGKYINFWMWVEDPENDTIYHSDSLVITKTACLEEETIHLYITVHLVEPRPSQYLVRISSDKWMHVVHVHSLSFRDLYIPANSALHTELLELNPLPVTALSNKLYERMYNFSHFNPIQSQIFYNLYYETENILLGAPTGSGKTVAAEICIFNLFNKNKNLKAVYIAPLKALVRERMEDWSKRFGSILNKRVIELTGDVTPGIKTLKKAHIIVTTPEKWDGLSRGWFDREYIQRVGLIIIDEIHLLGEDRGPVLEVIVSRINFIANQTGVKPRIVGLSTAMANAGSVSNWLGIKNHGLYNFRPSVRPVPLDVHVKGFPGKFYCPRMLSMNKPAYEAIKQFAPNSPVLIFCSSRKQTRLTASDLITHLLTQDDSKRWLHCEDSEIFQVMSTIHDPDVQYYLSFGIGLHHAGLREKDRKIVEELFLHQRIQVVIATATLAWGVNLPAHLVIIKGTEYFDGKLKQYVDMPITDILQMMGRAGRPQYDTSGVACVYVHDKKKNFFKRFLYEPFPIESNLMQVLPDHVNAEISSGTITSKSALMKYLTWTYFYRRLIENPTYYANKLNSAQPEVIEAFLSDYIDAVVNRLVECHCVTVTIMRPNNLVKSKILYHPTFYGRLASVYYISHKTIFMFMNSITWNATIMDLIQVLCRSEEYANFPVRHNEDKINKKLAESLNYDLKGEPYDSPHVKIALLLHTYLSRKNFPNQEYSMDFKSVTDQLARLLQAMMDVAINNSWFNCTMKIMYIMQMIIQGQYMDNHILLTIPGIYASDITVLETEIERDPTIVGDTIDLLNLKMAFLENKALLERMLITTLDHTRAQRILQHISDLPLLNWTLTISALNLTLSKNELVPLTLEEGKKYEFVLQVDRISNSTSLNVHAPRYPKPKTEGWCACLADVEHDYLFCSKKITVYNTTSCTLHLDAPAAGNYILSLWFLSDCYLGLVQQYDIEMTIESRPLSEQ